MARRIPRPNGKFLSLREAEAEYGLAYRTLYRWIERGHLARIDRALTGSSILIKRADLDRLLESHMTGVRS